MIQHSLSHRTRLRFWRYQMICEGYCGVWDNLRANAMATNPHGILLSLACWVEEDFYTIVGFREIICVLLLLDCEFLMASIEIHITWNNNMNFTFISLRGPSQASRYPNKNDFFIFIIKIIKMDISKPFIMCYNSIRTYICVKRISYKNLNESKWLGFKCNPHK